MQSWNMPYNEMFKTRTVCSTVTEWTEKYISSTLTDMEQRHSKHKPLAVAFALKITTLQDTQ